MTWILPTLSLDTLLHPASVQSPSVPIVSPFLAPSCQLILFPSASLLLPTLTHHPCPHPSLGDKRARLERVPRSFIPHHMGPKAKSSAKRLNQVCRTKCYELTLWVYNFMPFVAICLSKQPPFHTDIQTHTFPPTHPHVRIPPPKQSQGSGTGRHVPRRWRTRGSRVLRDQKELGDRGPRGLRGGREAVRIAKWLGRGQGPWEE